MLAYETSDEDFSDEESVHSANEDDDIIHTPLHQLDAVSQQLQINVEELELHRRTSIAEDVIDKKGVYGRFADKWFSKRGWNVEKRRALGQP